MNFIVLFLTQGDTYPSTITGQLRGLRMTGIYILGGVHTVSLHFDSTFSTTRVLNTEHRESVSDEWSVVKLWLHDEYKRS